MYEVDNTASIFEIIVLFYPYLYKGTITRYFHYYDNSSLFQTVYESLHVQCFATISASLKLDST